MAQTKSQIREMLAAAGIAPLKRYGQHFLIDGNLMGALVAAAAPGPRDVVLEVGPGTGALTERLLEVSGYVVAVEIDRGLQAICRGQFDASGRFTLVEGDVLVRKSQVEPRVIELLAERAATLGGRVMLIANLPYQIATPLLIDLLLEPIGITPLCFTVQAEVGERLMAPAGGREYGPISVVTQAAARVERIARVPPQAFWPVPKVDSVMLRVDRKPLDERGLASLRRLAGIVQACFQHRRKTLRSNLREFVGQEGTSRIETAGRWNLDDRPERLTVEQWIDLAGYVDDVGSGK